MRVVRRSLGLLLAVSGASACSLLDSTHAPEISSEAPSVPAWAQTLSLAALAPEDPEPVRKRPQSLWPAPDSARPVVGKRKPEPPPDSEPAAPLVLVATSKMTPIFARSSIK